jgi:predicted ester cyclase
MRFVLDWHNPGGFFGNPPTGERGTHIEQHMLTLRDGRIVEQVVSDVTLGIPPVRD